MDEVSDKQKNTIAQLKILRKRCKVIDVISPIDEKWEIENPPQAAGDNMISQCNSSKLDQQKQPRNRYLSQQK